MADKPWLAHYDADVPHSLQPYPDKTLIDFPTALHYFEPDEGEADNAGALEQMARLLPWLQQRMPL